MDFREMTLEELEAVKRYIESSIAFYSSYLNTFKKYLSDEQMEEVNKVLKIFEGDLQKINEVLNGEE